jgi:hypothetical protein
MKLRSVLLLAATISSTPVFASTSRIVYHLAYDNNGVLVVETITTNGTLGTLTSGDIIGVHLFVSDTGRPGIILEPLSLGYTTVQIKSTPVTATAQGLSYDTTNKQGYLKIGDTPYGESEFVLQYNGMMVVREAAATVYRFRGTMSSPRRPLRPLHRNLQPGFTQRQT